MCETNHYSRQLDGKSNYFLGRISWEWEIQCCWNMLHWHYEDGIGNWNLESTSLCSSMVWLLSWGARSKHVHGWNMPGSREGWGHTRAGCRAKLFYTSARTWDTHRGTQEVSFSQTSSSLLPCFVFLSQSGVGFFLSGFFFFCFWLVLALCFFTWMACPATCTHKFDYTGHRKDAWRFSFGKYAKDIFWMWKL